MNGVGRVDSFSFSAVININDDLQQVLCMSTVEFLRTPDWPSSQPPLAVDPSPLLRFPRLP